MLIAGTSRRCSASLGVATFPMHGEDGAALLKAAGLALHHAKMNGRGPYRELPAGVSRYRRKEGIAPGRD